MKKILIIASLALCCSLLASCEDFLDTKKYGAKTDWETQEDVEKALVALFSFNTNDSEGVTGRGITWFECCSDDMTVGRPQGEAEDIRNFRMSPSNGRDVKNNWKIMYEVNAKANNIIKVVPTMNLDNAFKTKATGTAYFEKNGFQARATYRWRDSFLAELAGLSANPEFRQGKAGRHAAIGGILVVGHPSFPLATGQLGWDASDRGPRESIRP